MSNAPYAVTGWWKEECDAIPIDIAREGVQLIRQNWGIVAMPNTVALGLALVGVLGPIGGTLISNGSALLALGNALRPLLTSPVQAPGARPSVPTTRHVPHQPK